MNVQTTRQGYPIPVSPPRTTPAAEPASNQAPINGAQIPGGPIREAFGERPEEAVRFWGATDVRLRLSLAEELSAIHTDKARSDLKARITGLPETFVALADRLVSPVLQTPQRGERFGQAVTAFDEAATAAVSAYDTSAKGAMETLKADLQAAFDSLYGSTLSVFAQPDGAQPAASTRAGEKHLREVPTELSKFMNALASTFSETVQEMNGKAGATSPEEPVGDGAPYGRVAAEYNRLRAQPEAAERVNVQG